MKKLALVALALVLTSLVSASSFLVVPTVQAQRPGPVDQPARGLIYRDLIPAAAGPCKGGYQVATAASGGMKVQCTHGPDAAPASMKVSETAPAVARRTAASAAQCDGDGVSGKRVQVIYARASDVPDRYADFQASIQQWAAEADAVFNNSALKTGGSRHVRFVQDAACNPVVENALLTPTGDDSFGNSNNELWYLGFNRTDRDYLIFMDAHAYCGIASFEYDDSPDVYNRNNLAPHYARVDAGCWSGVIAAHELTHNFGGVQMSAPNSDGATHCNDGYDNMCDHSGHYVDHPCADPAGDAELDCNEDDYFHTNPSPTSYLGTHWNVANSEFLIAPQTARVSSTQTGNLKGKRFIPADSFKQGSTVYVVAHVVDGKGANLANATVDLSVDRPDGSERCAISTTTDGNGNARGSCKLPRNAPKGTWRARVDGFAASGYQIDMSSSDADHPFIVQ